MRNSDDVGGETIRLTCLFFVLVSLTLAGLSAASRSAFPQPSWMSFGLAWIHCAAVIFTWQSTTLRMRAGASSHALSILATVAVLALPCIAGDSEVSRWTVTLALALICLFGLAEVAPATIRMSAGQGVILICVAPMLALVLFLWVNGKGYANVLEPELALLGLQSLDTMYHTAISSMLTQHGAVSTGLDGLVRTPYHALSHLWIGRSSEWLHTTPIHGYYLVIQIIGLPLLFFSVIASTIRQFDLHEERRARFPGIILLPFALLLLIAVADSNSYLVSESHLLGMMTFMIGLPLLLEQAREKLGCGSALRIAAICCAGILMTLSKVSIGAIWFAGFGYLVMRQVMAAQLSGIRVKWLAIAVLALAAGLLLLGYSVLPREHAQNVNVFPFQYARDFPIYAAINTLVIATAGFIVCLRLARKHNSLPVEVLGIMMGASWILTMTIDVPGGSSYYFLNVGTWVAVVVLAHCALLRIDFGASRVHQAALIAILTLSVLANREIMRSHTRMNGRVAQVAQLAGAPAPTSIFAAPETASLLADTVGAQTVETILSRFRFGEANALIFIPPENREFWEFDQNCSRKGLFIPALTGIPLLNGLPPAYLGCSRVAAFGEFYGYSEYSTDSNSTDLTDADICAKASSLGYSRVGVLSRPTDLRLLSCAGPGAPRKD